MPLVPVFLFGLFLGHLFTAEFFRWKERAQNRNFSINTIIDAEYEEVK